MVEHHDAVGERQRLGTIVCHVDDRELLGAGEGAQFETQPVAERLVEGGQRLVEQQSAGPAGKCACERHPLSLPAGQRRRIPLLQTRKSHQLEHLGDPRRAVGTRDLRDLQRIRDIAAHIPVRPDGVVLEHHAQTALLRGDTPSAVGNDVFTEPDRAVGGVEKAGHRAEQGRLPRSGRTDEGYEFAVPNVEVDSGQSCGAVGEAQVDTGQGDRGHEKLSDL